MSDKTPAPKKPKKPLTQSRRNTLRGLKYSDHRVHPQLIEEQAEEDYAAIAAGTYDVPKAVMSPEEEAIWLEEKPLGLMHPAIPVDPGNPLENEKTARLFAEKVRIVKEGEHRGCWEWTAGRTGKDGYGVFNVPRPDYLRFGTKNTTLSMNAHVLMCRLWHGEAPSEGLHVRHVVCGWTSCVNRHHLAWGTPKENAEDKRRHAAQRKAKAAAQ